MSVIATTTMHFGAIIMSFFVMVILNQMSSYRCSQFLKTQGELERELAGLEDARTREATRWEEMKTPERIEAALGSHGLLMKTPRAEQRIRMRSDGTPYPGQPSLARARQRNGIPTAGLAPASSASSASRSSYRRRATH